MSVKNLSIKPLVFAVFLILCLSTCDHQQGDMAKIIISFSNEGRAAFYDTSESVLQQLEHRIVLTNKRETLNFQNTGTKTFITYAAPGIWTIWVESWLREEDEGEGEIYDVFAAGTIDVNLKAGQDNKFTLPMYRAHLVRFVSNGGSDVPYQVVFNNERAVEPPNYTHGGKTFNGWFADKNFTGEPYEFGTPRNESITLYANWSAKTVQGDTLADKLSWLYGNAVDGGEYIVTVDEDESVNSGNFLGYGKKTITITMNGDGTVNLNNVNNNFMFQIGPNVTLILENITLNGREDNHSPLILVSGGTLIMNEGAVITGNISDRSSRIGSSGVAVGENGYFLMNKGTISNNTISGSGAGVEVYKGRFDMRGGTITGNTANVESNGEGGAGGGVGVWDDGIFNMSGGEIYNNTANTGGGVCVGNNEGTFIMSGGKIHNNHADDWHGGGVNVYSEGTFTMTDGEIYKNTALSGGGVYVYGTFDMSGGANIHENRVTQGGGGVEVFGEEGRLNMSGGKISDNTAESSGGGGVYVGGSAIFTMTKGEISKNTSEYAVGGGVNVSGGGNLIMNGGEISSNRSYWSGGGVYVFSSGFFDKTNGTIMGYDAGDKKNEVYGTWPGRGGEDGSAVLVQTNPDESDNYLHRREKTAGPLVNLYYNGKTNPRSYSGDWEYSRPW